MLRLMTALIFTALGGAVGFSLADRLRAERIICADIGYLLQRTEFLVCSCSEDVFTVCAKLKGDTSLNRLTFLEKLPDRYVSGTDFRELWRTAVTSQALQAEERDILLRLGEILGKSDSSSQRTAINALNSELADISSRRTEIFLKNGRLYRSAGILFGIMAGILVI